MPKWKRQLEVYSSLIEELMKKKDHGEGELRFNRSVIIASDVAQQYFCEKKVEMKCLHGEIETDEKIIGSIAHERLLEGSEQVRREELWEKIYGEKPILALELLLLARHNEIVLAGRPDSVMFRRGSPLLVFEYKFSKSTVAYRSYHVQAKTYGILLGNMGFDVSRLFYAIVVADPEARNDRRLKQEVVRAIGTNGPKEAVLNIRNAVIYVQRFDKDDAEKDLDWAIEFWKGSRDAVITSNPKKCVKCEYKVECDQSIHKT